MENRFNNIRVILAQSVADGIAPLSRGIAEAIVLGKSLGDTFRQFVLNAIVGAVAGLIQYYLTKFLIFVLEKLFPS
jgi:energy-converting hydrogenase Eha subunit A